MKYIAFSILFLTAMSFAMDNNQQELAKRVAEQHQKNQFNISLQQAAQQQASAVSPVIPSVQPQTMQQQAQCAQFTIQSQQQSYDNWQRHMQNTCPWLRK